VFGGISTFAHQQDVVGRSASIYSEETRSVAVRRNRDSGLTGACRDRTQAVGKEVLFHAHAAGWATPQHYPAFLVNYQAIHQTSRPIHSDLQIHGSECVVILYPQQSDGQTSG
jgi:hypothetical protein